MLGAVDSGGTSLLSTVVRRAHSRRAGHQREHTAGRAMDPHALSAVQRTPSSAKSVVSPSSSSRNILALVFTCDARRERVIPPLPIRRSSLLISRRQLPRSLPHMCLQLEVHRACWYLSSFAMT